MNAPLAPLVPNRVDVIAPDPRCAALLVRYAGPAFPAELVAGVPLLVRMQLPREPQWVGEFLALVKRWLESVRLPEAEVLYGERTYLIPSSLDFAQLIAAAERTTGLPLGGSG